MAILKYANKLRKMSPEEILFRVKQQARNRMEQMRWKMNNENGISELFITDDIAGWNHQKYRFPARRVHYYAFNHQRETLSNIYKERFPESYQQAIAAADKLLKHEFHLLGLDVTLPDPIPWNTNPQTGQAYPLLYQSLMDTFNTERYGDVKYVWELNRHQFFIEVAKAYYLTGDEKYPEKIWSWIESFIEEVPNKIGINHTSVLEHAVRIYAWIWAYYFTQDSPVWTSERIELITTHLLLQGDMIEKNLSYFYSPYNHLIGELAALTFMGTIYGNSPKMGIWRDKYWREMERQIEKQVNRDGFTVEQASYYHHFTIGFYLMLVVLRKQNGLSISDHTLQLVEKSLEFIMHLTRPDGQLPKLGDIDSARSIYFYRPEPMWNLRSFQALGAVIFERGDMKYVAGEACEELLWLLGPEGLKAFDELPAVPPAETSRAFKPSGYYMMRDGWQKNSNYLTFDCGEIAHGVYKDETPSAAHGHGDILSFELSVDGKPIIVDPGFNTYFGPLEWHRYFRSTRGHNVIEVNGAGQATHEGRIAWSRVSSPKFDHWFSNDTLDFAGGAIDGYPSLEEKAFQRRYILFRKGKYFLVMDEISGNNSGNAHRIESSFHFAPGELQSNGKQLNYNNRFLGLLSHPDNARVDIRCGEDGPDGGWHCQGYGYASPAPVMRITLDHALPAYLGMVIPLKDFPEKDLKFSHQEIDRGVTCYRIQHTNGEETVYLNPLRRQVTFDAFGGVTTDALCTIDSRSTDQENELCFVKVNHLQIGNRNLNSQLTDRTIAGLKYSTQSDKPKIELWKLEN